ncbi:MAG: dUTP diphosphatase [Acidaminococcales bacterium]|jgi:dUTP pyrophosphatase|nr:dUTP diphosphatase [Acidaminococcales bacterium]
MRVRGFETVTKYGGANINLPKRRTAQSAGYDIAAAESAVLKAGLVTKVPTGLKAYMRSDEFLGVHIRSGLSVNNALSLVNGQGIIDADYYNNPDNEGHIIIAFLNHSGTDVTIEKGERIAQGIFYKYLMADGDREQKKEARRGGFGSTG